MQLRLYVNCALFVKQKVCFYVTLKNLSTHENFRFISLCWSKLVICATKTLEILIVAHKFGPQLYLMWSDEQVILLNKDRDFLGKEFHLSPSERQVFY